DGGRRPPAGHLLLAFARNQRERLRAWSAAVAPGAIGCTRGAVGLVGDEPSPPRRRRPRTSTTTPKSAATAIHVHVVRRGRRPLGSATVSRVAGSAASASASSPADDGRNFGSRARHRITTASTLVGTDGSRSRTGTIVPERCCSASSASDSMSYGGRPV